MRTYIVDGITIQIGAKVVAVRVGGRTITPQEKKKGWLKHSAEEYWRNNYFRTRTKTHLSIKAAEIISRSIGIHSLYLLTREHLYPYLPEIIALLQTIHWPEMIFRIDIGFALGLMTTKLIKYFKSYVINERSEKA